MIRFRPAAAREFAADFRYYEKDHPGRGARFIAAVDVALRQIEAAPLRFTILYEPDIRSAKVKRFPYRVVYVIVNDAIEVLAVSACEAPARVLAASAANPCALISTRERGIEVRHRRDEGDVPFALAQTRRTSSLAERSRYVSSWRSSQLAAGAERSGCWRRSGGRFSIARPVALLTSAGASSCCVSRSSRLAAAAVE